MRCGQWCNENRIQGEGLRGSSGSTSSSPFVHRGKNQVHRRKANGTNFKDVQLNGEILCLEGKSKRGLTTREITVYDKNLTIVTAY